MTWVQSKDALISAIRAANGHPIDAHCHLSWFFADPPSGVGVRELEDHLGDQGLTAYPLDCLPAEHERFDELCDRLLTGPTERSEFDPIAARLLKAADRYLAENGFTSQQLAERSVESVDGHTYLIQKRRDYIGELGDPYASMVVERRAASVMPLTPNYKAVRQSVTDGETAIEFADLPDAVKARLGRISSGSAEDFSIMMWPFAGLTFQHHGLMCEDLPGNEYCLNGIAAEVELEKQVIEAVDEARRLKTTVLLFPELSMTPNACATLRRLLREAPRDQRWPVLTVASFTHLPEPAPINSTDAPRHFLNEAVLYGPRGDELLRHTKLVRFSTAKKTKLFGKEFPEGLAEAIRQRPPDRQPAVRTLETPVGTISVVICKDLLEDDVQRTLRRSTVSVVLVPSLSSKTTTHTKRAEELMKASGASVFVANRDLVPTWDDSKGLWKAEATPSIRTMRDLIRNAQAGGAQELQATRQAAYTAMLEHFLKKGASFFMVPRFGMHETDRLVPCGRRNPDDRKLLFTVDPPR